VDRVFLDANVLFSAAYLPDSRLRELWSLADAELLTSAFALGEARRNLLIHAPSAASLLDELSAQVVVLSEAAPPLTVPGDVGLPGKDEPILAAAVVSGCTHLLTGDTRHFGSLYGRMIHGVLVLTPAQYFARRRGRRSVRRRHR